MGDGSPDWSRESDQDGKEGEYSEKGKRSPDDVEGRDEKGKGSSAKGSGDTGKGGWGVLPGPSAMVSGDSSSVAKGKSKSRGEMAAEEKRVANLNNSKTSKTSRTAANKARCSKDAGWVEPRVRDGQFNVPSGHRLSRQPPRALRNNVGGLWQSDEDSGRRTAAEAKQ